VVPEPAELEPRRVQSQGRWDVREAPASASPLGLQTISRTWPWLGAGTMPGRGVEERGVVRAGVEGQGTFLSQPRVATKAARCGPGLVEFDSPRGAAATCQGHPHSQPSAAGRGAARMPHVMWAGPGHGGSPLLPHPPHCPLIFRRQRAVSCAVCVSATEGFNPHAGPRKRPCPETPPSTRGPHLLHFSPPSAPAVLPSSLPAHPPPLHPPHPHSPFPPCPLQQGMHRHARVGSAPSFS